MEKELNRRLEAELDLLADDPNLLADLKKMKRQTKNANISAQESLAKFNLADGEDEFIQNDNRGDNLVDSGAERITKSIGGEIANA